MNQILFSNILEKKVCRGRSRGVFAWDLETPLQKYIKEAKRVMYWYKNTKMHYFFKASVISGFHVRKQPIYSKRLHPSHPLLHIWLITSGGTAPPDPLHQRYTGPLCSDPLSENSGSAPCMVHETSNSRRACRLSYRLSLRSSKSQ